MNNKTLFSRDRILFLVAFSAFLVVAAFFFLTQKKPSVEAAWFNDQWGYRKSVTVTNNTSQETNKYITVTLDTSASGKFQGDCGDLRFTSAGGKTYPYYIVSGCTTASTVIHVKLDVFPAGVQIIYYYYGNPSAQNGFASADFSSQASNYTIGSLGSEELGGGPVAYWKFDEGYGTNVRDSSPNASNGTVNSATWQTGDKCISEKCLYFTSTNNVSVADPTNGSLDFGTGNFTISAWIRTGTSADNRNLIRKGAGAGLSGWRFGLSSGVPNVLIGDTATFTEGSLGSTSIADNKWHQLLVVFNRSGNAVGYVDGKQVGTLAISTVNLTVDNASAVTIGNTFATYTGFLDDVKIYNYARTAAQIKADFASKGSGTGKGTSVSLSSSRTRGSSLSEGLVGYWKMDETAANSCTGGVNDSCDASGNGLDGAWNGTNITAAAGKYGNGVNFNGSDDYTNIADNVALQAGTTMTVSAWFKLDTTGSDKRIIDKTNNGTGYALVANSTTPRFITGNGSTYDNLDGTTTLATGTWYHIVGTVDNGTKRIFVNGNLENTASITFNGIGTGNSFKIGTRSAGQYLDGTIDEARYYNRALSPKEVRDLYNWAPGPIRYFPMDDGVSGNAQTLVDKSGNSGNATTYWGANASGMNCTVPGKFGKACRFDGDDDYALFTATSVGTAYTLEAWVYPDAATGTDWFNILSNNGQPQWGMPDSTLQYQLYNRVTGTNLTRNQWSHVVVTRDGDAHKLYVNGTLNAQATTAAGSDTYSVIGAYFYADVDLTDREPWNGKLDEVKIYNYPRSQKQVVEDMNAGHPVGGSPVGSQVGYWKMDEGQGHKISSTVWNQAGTTTNIVINPSVETDLNNITTQGAGTISRSTEESLIGGYSIKYVATNNQWNGWQENNISAAASTTYIVSTWVKPAADGVGKQLRWWIYDQSSNYITEGGNTTLVTGWQKLSFSFSTQVGDTGIKVALLTPTGWAGGAFTFYSDGVQAETGSSTTPYCDGSLTGNGTHSWSGTAHASTSTCTYGQDGDINGAAWSNSGKFGKALSFDGSNDYVDIGRAIDLPTGAPFTVTAWINRTSGSGNYPVGWYQGTNGFLLYDTGTARVASGGTNYTTTTTLSTTGSWNYLVMVFDGSTLKTYHNGKAKDSISASYTKEGTGRLHIGNLDYSSGQTGFFNGLIDEVKIYNAALTEDEIKLDYNRGQAMVLGTLSDTSQLTGGSVASSSAAAAYCVPGDTAACGSPIGEWKMDEKTGANAYDTSGNGNTGTVTNALWKSSASCKVGACLYFDGTGDEVTLGAAKFDTITEATIEGFFYYTGTFDTNHKLWDHYKDSNNRQLVFVGYPGGWGNKLVFENIVAGSNRAVTSDSTLTASTWYHFAVTCGTGGMKMYLNGKLQTSTNATTDCFSTIAATTTNAIGATFIGQIDNFKIYNYARSQAQIAWDYNRGAPIAHWKLDECQGGTLNDSSGNGYSASISIGATGTQTAVGTCTTSGTAWYNGVTGKYNSSLNYDGYDDRASVTGYSALYAAVYNNFTYSLWVKYAGLSQGQWPVLFGPTDTHRYPGIRGGSGYGANAPYLEWGNYPTCDGSSYSTLSAGTTITDGNWHHLLYTYDGATVKVYLDGLYKNQTARSGFCSGATDFYVNYQYYGQVDDARVYTYPLTGSQVKTVFNQGAGIRFAPITGAP